MENTKEEFKKLSGIDLTDHEHSGVFPYYKDGSKWSSISRGKAWQMYAQWLEDQSTSQQQTIERLRDLVKRMYESMAEMQKDGLELYDEDMDLIEEAKQLLNTTEPKEQ